MHDHDEAPWTSRLEAIYWGMGCLLIGAMVYDRFRFEIRAWWSDRQRQWAERNARDVLEATSIALRQARDIVRDRWQS